MAEYPCQSRRYRDDFATLWSILCDNRRHEIRGGGAWGNLEEVDAGLGMTKGLDEGRYLEAPEFIPLYVGYLFEPHRRYRAHTPDRTTPGIGMLMIVKMSKKRGL